jgi:glycosyltransferase involved in cell wall biosynthesis
VLVIATSVLLGVILGVWLQLAWRASPLWTLPELGDEAPDAMGAWPRLSVVVACRNEEAGLERALTSVLAQDYPGLEVVVVDDRSDDATGTILRDLGQRHAALTLERVETLPAGWLGKTNALHRGAARARGEWLLFTDADVVFAPGALRRAVAWATREALGHAVAFPRFVAPGLLERAFVSLFGLFLVSNQRVGELRRAGSAGYIGIGAFNLVRRDAYDAIGGHERLRLEVADDLKLGLVLRRSGVRQGCVLAGAQVTVRWQAGFAASMRGLVKNFFAGCEYSWVEALRAGLGLPLIATFPALSLVLAPSLPWLLPNAGTRLLALAALAVPVALHGVAARRLAGGAGYEGVLLPFASVCLGAVALASALVATTRGAIIWRGTRYPLRDLDAACVREADWPRAPAPGALRATAR